VAQGGQGPLLSVTAEQQVLWTIVRVTGDLDCGTQSRLGDCLFTLIKQAEQPRICVDVRGLQFCDSAGMACLVVAWTVAQARGGSLVLLRPRAWLERKLAAIGLAAMLPVVEQVPYEACSPNYVG
jgi:anti-anti-sigma factor